MLRFDGADTEVYFIQTKLHKNDRPVKMSSLQTSRCAWKQAVFINAAKYIMWSLVLCCLFADISKSEEHVILEEINYLYCDQIPFLKP